MGQEEKKETLEEARARFWANYLNLGGQDEAWFDLNVEPLLKIAAPPIVQRPKAPPAYRLYRSTFLPWGSEQFIQFYADERPAALIA
jgi:hypothetical protein